MRSHRPSLPRSPLLRRPAAVWAGDSQRHRSSASPGNDCRNPQLRSAAGDRFNPRRVIPISPLARRCERPCLATTSVTISRFTADRISFCQHILQRPDVQRPIGHDQLQPRRLFFQPAHIRNLKSAVTAASGAEGSVRESVPPTQFAGLRSRLLQHPEDSLFAKPCALHVRVPFRQALTYRWDACRGRGQPA